jgi:predicted ATP-grasp superfamily ATP-dependent carboligase
MLRSGGDFLVDAEMLFDVGDADFKLEALVDFVLLELAHLGVKAIDFSVELVNPAIESRFDCGEIVLGRHVLDDLRKHISEFVEGRFLWRHMRRVYHSRSVVACMHRIRIHRRDRWATDLQNGSG